MMWSWMVPVVLFVALVMVGANKKYECREAERWELMVTALLAGCLASALTALIASW